MAVLSGGLNTYKNVVSKNNCLMLCNYYDDNKPQIMRYKPLEIGLNKLRHYTTNKQRT